MKHTPQIFTTLFALSAWPLCAQDAPPSLGGNTYTGATTIAAPNPAPRQAPGEPRRGNPRGEANRPIGGIFGLLDTNHDGVLDADEIAHAPEVLRKLARSSDGKIGPDELRASGGGDAQWRPQAGGPAGGQRPEDLRRDGQRQGSPEAGAQRDGGPQARGQSEGRRFQPMQRGGSAPDAPHGQQPNANAPQHALPPQQGRQFSQRGHHHHAPFMHGGGGFAQRGQQFGGRPQFGGDRHAEPGVPQQQGPQFSQGRQFGESQSARMREFLAQRLQRIEAARGGQRTPWAAGPQRSEGWQRGPMAMAPRFEGRQMPQGGQGGMRAPGMPQRPDWGHQGFGPQQPQRPDFGPGPRGPMTPGFGPMQPQLGAPQPNGDPRAQHRGFDGPRAPEMGRQPEPQRDGPQPWGGDWRQHVQ